MKIKKTFSFDKESLDIINNFCKENSINASSLTQKLWLKYIKDEKNK